MEKIPYEAVGFAFPNEKMMEKALKEAEGIRYVKNSADLTDPQVVFKVYRQMVSQRLFETPVGYAFLYELQEFLWTNPAISNDTIPPIPVAAAREAAPVRPESKAEARQPQSAPRVRTEVKTKIVHKTEVKHVDYKVKFKACMSICVVLLLIVIGMFAVTATSGNINIVNYENALIEKYEHWEAQLDEREAKLKEREAATAGNAVQ